MSRENYESNVRRLGSLRRTRGVIKVGVVVVGIAMLLAACGSSTSARASKTTSLVSHPLVAFMIPDSTTPRWTGQDAPDFIRAMKRLDPTAKVVVENANNSANEQEAQGQALLTKGVKAIVLIAVSETQSGVLVRQAHAADVPVIAYTRLPANSPVSYMVGSDPFKIGVVLGKYIISNTKPGDTVAVLNGSPTDSFAKAEHNGFMSVLKPVFKSGRLHEVGDVWTPNWEPTDATSEMEAILTETHNNVQAVLAPNDGTAGGVIAALARVGLAGKIPVTGIDGGLTGDRLILKGDLSMTVWRDPEVEATHAAMIVAKLLHKQTPPKFWFTDSVFNGEVHIPLWLDPMYVITKNNMGLEIKAGAFSKAQLCAGMPKVGPCK